MLRHHHATTTSQSYLVPEKRLNYTVHIYINIYIPTHPVCTLIMQPVSFQGSKHPVCRFSSLCCCSHSLCFVPYSPSSLSCSNWMCSRRISSQLLAGVESNSAHAAFSADRCRPIPYRAIFHPLEKRIFVPRGWNNKHRTRRSAPRTFKCELEENRECLSKEKRPVGPNLSYLLVFSAWAWWGLDSSRKRCIFDPNSEELPTFGWYEGSHEALIKLQIISGFISSSCFTCNLENMKFMVKTKRKQQDVVTFEKLQTTNVYFSN